MVLRVDWLHINDSNVHSNNYLTKSSQFRTTKINDAWYFKRVSALDRQRAFLDIAWPLETLLHHVE